MSLLKELPSITGKASVRGKISYVSQEPWVFSGTVRQNILFGQEYNERKYKRIVRVCALDKVSEWCWFAVGVAQGVQSDPPQGGTPVVEVLRM